MSECDKETLLGRLAGTAVDLLTKRHCLRRAFLVDQAQVRDPATGRASFRFAVSGEGEEAQRRFTLVLDEDGRVDDRPEAAIPFDPPGINDLAAPRLALPQILISPTSNDLTLNEGDVFEETVTVSVPANPGVPRADIYFLADTTASMSDTLAAVQGGTNAILNALAGNGVDLAFGVGNYRDFPNEAHAFQHQLAPTDNAPQVAAAIAGWNASGGGDRPEGQLFALDALAEPPGGTIGWRPHSKRIIVWFGDAPGHEPICPALTGATAPITTASVTAKLVSEAITVLAISTSTPGLDDDPAVAASDYAQLCGPAGGVPGQASSIAAATGGHFVAGIQPAHIVATITALLTTAVAGINNLRLVASGATAPFVSRIAPAAGFGPLAADRAHRLTFRVELVGVHACRKESHGHTGSLEVVADGRVVAAKPVRVEIPGCRKQAVYVVKYVCGIQDDACGCGTPVLPGRYATEINLHNPQEKEVEVVKRVIPLVLAGAARGREPRTSAPAAVDRVVLPPHGATMDDCCRLTGLLLGAAGGTGPNIGFVEITASAALAVTAVYTLSGADGGVSIDVETIPAHT